jgi:hypothetical protein
MGTALLEGTQGNEFNCYHLGDSMNERIKKFAEQATRCQYWNANTQVMQEDFDKEKFAELIILECADKVFDIFDALPDISVSDLQYYIRDRIKEHFGVEE